MQINFVIEEKQEETIRKNRNKISQVSGIPKNSLKKFRTIPSNWDSFDFQEEDFHFRNDFFSISQIKEYNF